MWPECPWCKQHESKCRCGLTDDPPQVLEIKTGSGVEVRGTVGFKTVFVWSEVKGKLAVGTLSAEELRELGRWCLFTAAKLES